MVSFSLAGPFLNKRGFFISIYLLFVKGVFECTLN